MRQRGVVVDYFQRPHLDGMRHLIDAAKASCSPSLAPLFVVRSLGLGGPVLTVQHPLDFATRRTMILDEYPAAQIIEMHDLRNWSDWSEQLTTKITLAAPDCGLYIYADPEFGSQYTGPIGCAVRPVSRSAIESPLDSADFRWGVMYAAQQLAKSRPRTFQTVDIAVVRKLEHSLVPDILMGRKAGETGWCLPGGHVMPSDQDSLHAARRELEEETNITNAGLFFLGEYRVDDWRYRSASQPFTQLFLCYFQGQPEDVRAADDLSELAWQPLTFPMTTEVVPEHSGLLHSAWFYVQRNPPRPQVG